MNSNVTPIDTQLNVLSPDMKILSDSQRDMQNYGIEAGLLYDKTSYLPEPWSQLKRLDEVVAKEHWNLRGSCQTMSTDITFKLEQLRLHDRDLNEASDQHDLDEIQTARAKTLKKALTTVDAEAVKLTDALSKMSETFDRHPTQGFQESLKQDITRIESAIEEDKIRHAGLDEQRQVLSEAIDALASKGFVDIAQETILTAEKVAALALLPSQLAQITQALALATEHMKATLDQAAAGINYLALVKQRDNLRVRAEALTEQLAAKDKEKLGLSQRVDLIKLFHAMDDHRSAYVGQYQKIVQTVEHFLKVNKADAADDKERSKRFISSGLLMVSYLEPLQQPTRRP